MIDILGEFRQAVRRWAARPAFTLSAILTLALGTGATTAIYSVVDTVLLRPLPWPDADRLVNIWVTRPRQRTNPVSARTWDRGTLSWPIFTDLQQRATTLDSVALWREAKPTLNGEPNEVIDAMQVSSAFLPLLGLQPHLGRFFTVEEDADLSDAVIVSHETWQRRYGGDRSILSRTVGIDDLSRRIVGVLPPGFAFQGPRPEFLIPAGTFPPASRTPGNHVMNGLARLAPGVTIARAHADVEPLVRGTDPPAEKSARVARLSDDQIGTARRPLWILLAAAGVLLLIACANVAGLLLGDASARRHEMAVRAALGGSRARIVRQVLTESLVLAAAACAAGLLVAAWLTPWFVSLAPAGMARLADVAIDGRVAAIAVLVSLGTMIVFGLAPSLVLSSVSPAGALRLGGRDDGLARTRGQGTIVVAQVALAVVLLIGASLLGETALRLRAVPVGFDDRNLIVAGVRAPRLPVLSADARLARTTDILETLGGLTGVVSVAGSAGAPFTGSFGSNGIEIEGRGPEFRANGQRQIVTDRYFETMGMAVRAGRAFDQSDGRAGRTAVVSAEFARRYYDGNAVGRRFRLNQDWLTIVGVVEDAKQQSFTEGDMPTFYALNRQLPDWSINQYVVRTTVPARTLLAPVRAAIERRDSRLVVSTIDTMDHLLTRVIVEERFRATLSALFGGLALALASIGLYGLLARGVADRRREIGVRVALGARPEDVRALVVRQALRYVASGLAIGLPVAGLVSGFLATMLFGVTARSPHTFAAVTAVLVVTALAATIVPARRAGRTDPISALRD